MPDLKVAVLGATGQVGRALVNLLGEQAVPLRQSDLDLSRPADLFEKLDLRLGQIKLRALINAAAYTQVDLAEKEETLNFNINAKAPEVLAAWCGQRSIPLVHYSTDYVFSDSQMTRPWNETDPVAPVNAYGRAKAQGEDAIRNALSGGGRWLIFRTSWVYDALGKNFPNTLLRLGRERETLKIVSDQIGAPTYAPHLAQATLAALESALKMNPFPSGIYHLCNSGETSWHGFASAVLELARSAGMPLTVKSCLPIPTADYPTPARRPLNSRLNCSKAATVLGLTLPTWKMGLSENMKILTQSMRDSTQ